MFVDRSFKIVLLLFNTIVILFVSNVLLFDNNKALAQNITFDGVRHSHFKVRDIKITGNTVFSDKKLKEIATGNKRQISSEKLFDIAAKITDYYNEQGYLSSFAFVPTQESNNSIEIQIVEASLESINIKGLSRFNESYILSRLPKTKQILNVKDTIASLKKLKEDPLIKDLTASIEQLEWGKNILYLEIVEDKSLRASFLLSNVYSPSVGSIGGKVNTEYHLFGYGDLVELGYAKTEGLSQISTSYSFPISKGKVRFAYSNADTKIIEEPVSAFDIQAELETYKFDLERTIAIDDSSEFKFDLSVEKIESETFIREDFSFPFVEGLKDGSTEINVIRLGQEYFSRGSESSLALRSQFSLGVDLFGSTVTETGIDGLFWNWQGQAQWLKKFGSSLFVSNLNIQLTDDKLLPIEQFTLGGFNSIRGYRGNLSLGDNGVGGTIELQIPLIKASYGEVRLIPFVDLGTVWNNARAVETNTLASAGLGLEYRLDDRLMVRVDYGIPLVEVDLPDNFSTEQQINFQLLVRP